MEYTGGFSQNKSHIHLNTKENPNEIVDYIFGCTASENKITKVFSYPINRILTVMLIIVGENLLLQIGTSGQVPSILQDDFLCT